MKILNTFSSSKDSLKFFNLEGCKVVFELGEYKIYKEFDKSFIHTYQGIAFSQTCAPNKEIVMDLYNGNYSNDYWFQRKLNFIKKGKELLCNDNQ